ncbi:adenylate/guanylate cyclase domain-containing protein [Rothia sp. P6271]|uniref:adenylate/guanylate cyclase domain-containing protein n=1 Tax=unclassified Rothia (in: high G+C Gram-positive bacteria) TaxID=2689056 RepID=UPI003AD6AFCA
MEKPAPGSDDNLHPGPLEEEFEYSNNRVQSNVYRTKEDREAVKALEKFLLGTQRNLTSKEVIEQAGSTPLLASKIWHALGIPDISENEIYFTGADAEGLKKVVELTDKHGLDLETTVSIARSMGQLTDRIVAWQIEEIVDDISKQQGLSDGKARQELLKVLPELITTLQEILSYTYRRQYNAGVLRLALRNEEGISENRVDLPLLRGIGFIDLVSYTTLSCQMNEKTLGKLVKTFEQRCAEIIAVGGGRIIKTVGDEVLFLTETPDAAARISLALSKAIEEHPDLPHTRVAFVWGRILPKLGDVYGPTVNLAARLVGVADAGMVLTNDDTAQTLKDDGRFRFTPQPKRSVRGFGDITPIAVESATGNELEIDVE